MNFLITGHTSGIGKAIFEKFNGVGLSKSTGFNILNDDITPYLKNCDVFINNAYDNSDPWAQTKLLYKSKHVPKIICIGSNTTDQTKKKPHPYQSAKLALENSCNQLFYLGYNITLIKLGYVNTPRVSKITDKKMEATYVANLIEWILQQPYRVKEISIQS